MKRNTSILLYLLFLIGCDSKSNVSEYRAFHTKDYILKEVQKDDFNKRSSEIYVHKDDSSKKMKVVYWSNQNVQLVAFFTNRKRDGPLKIYDTKGTLQFSTLFLNDKETGLSIEYSDSGEIQTIQLKNNGKKITDIEL